MTTTRQVPDRINIDDSTIKDAESSVKNGATRNASLVLQDVDGHLHTLPQSLQHVPLGALDSIARNGSVSIRRCPEELSSTAAAELLDVSRPTVLKWARDGRLHSFKVGTHTRFHREDVLAFRATREQERRSAFDELRTLDMEHIEEFVAEAEAGYVPDDLAWKQNPHFQTLQTVPEDLTDDILDRTARNHMP